MPSRSFSTSYGYDAASNRTSFTDPESGSTAYVYDTLNRLQTLTPPTAFTTGSFGFTYDALSRRTQMTRPNGVTTNYSYDNLSRLTSVLHQLSGSTIDGATYTVDNAGNRTAKTDQRTAVATSYGYDNIYQLLSATQGATTTESYTYDPVGNRTASLGVSSYTTNSSNELTSNSNASFSYDSNGNQTSKTDSTGTTNYSWDFENRLASVTLPGSGGTVSFKYDPFGRRIYKSSSSGTSVYAYDGNELVEEANSSGGVVARYSHNLSIDEPLAMLRSSTTSYYQADGLRSVTSLSSGTGTLAQTYTFDSYGNQTASSGSVTNAFRYTGREFDSETGLYFYRARYYDSATGRFVSEDPIGFDGGVDFYRYVHNSPIGFSDPLGLSPADVQRIQETCKRCTQALTDSGRRLPGSGGWRGFGNDNQVLLGILKGLLRHGDPTDSGVLQGCKSQAGAVKSDCFEGNPLFKGWSFSEQPWWLGSHTVVLGQSSDPNDPLVLCDPWRNYTWTVSNQHNPDPWPHFMN